MLVAILKSLCDLAKILISDSQMKTIFDFHIQSFDDRRLLFWILGINKPISHCDEKRFGLRAPFIENERVEGGPIDK